jgi:hypothetical protein
METLPAVSPTTTLIAAISHNKMIRAARDMNPFSRSAPGD